MAEPAPPASVEVVYALPELQAVVGVPLEPGLTAGGAIERSGLRERFPEIAARELAIGIYGRRVGAAHPLAAGDRVEILRPLRADPRQMRRDLVADGRVMGGEAPRREAAATTKAAASGPDRSAPRGPR